MSKLTKDQIADYAEAAGFVGKDLNVAVAIALAESGGDPEIIGDLTLGRSVGLWQISERWHPEYDEQALKDPQTNANAAFKIFTEANSTFQPWSTFKNLAYERFLTPPLAHFPAPEIDV